MKQLVFLVMTLVLLGACVSNAPLPAPVKSYPHKTLTVFAAASLTDAFAEIAASFELANPGVDVALNFAGSNTLRAQIEAGAQAGVFASANVKEMDTLIDWGLVNHDATHIFLSNRLVVIVPERNPAELSKFEDLARPGLKLVMAAEEVPAGQYTRQVLDKVGLDFKNRVLANIVSYETDVKQVSAKVQLGEADAGIVYASDAVAAPELLLIQIPARWNVLAEYPIAPLKDAPEPELSAQFVAFVLSPEGQAILQKWGFSSKPSP